METHPEVKEMQGLWEYLRAMVSVGEIQGKGQTSEGLLRRLLYVSQLKSSTDWRMIN